MAGIVSSGIVENMHDFKGQLEEVLQYLTKIEERWCDNGNISEEMRNELESWKTKHGISDEAGLEIIDIFQKYLI